VELAEAEARIGIVLPEEHRRAMLDPADPIHNACEFLVHSSPHRLLELVAANEFLHAPDYGNRWPAFLVAFASNGCGDYFAYDLRTASPRVIYIDPDETVWENLASEDMLVFESFAEWYTDRLSRRSNDIKSR
jgi:hypothetical protein